MNLPLANLGFKTSQPQRIIHFSKDVEDWYADLLIREKNRGSDYSEKQVSDEFLRNFYSDPSYRAKVVARQEGCILIEVFRWLEITKQTQSHHLWLISLGGINYIKL